MIPFGKQQEILRDLSTSSPEELSGNCRKTVYYKMLAMIFRRISAAPTPATDPTIARRAPCRE
jgi:hypothetical protein